MTGSISSSYIKISNNHCTADFRSIEPCCGAIRVEGWISAPSRDEGFDFCHFLRDAINKAADRRLTDCLGAFCLEDRPDVFFPFSFDVQPSWHDKYIRTETLEETIARIQSVLRKVRRAGVSPTGLA